VCESTRASSRRTEEREINVDSTAMTAAHLTVEELATRLKVEPAAVKTLLSEIAVELTKEYLTIDELAQRLTLDRKTIKNKMACGIFMKGVHYFSPDGIGPRFKWSAVQAWLEAKDESASACGADAIPMARGYLMGNSRQSKQTY
jgi:hypothetical protein